MFINNLKINRWILIYRVVEHAITKAITNNLFGDEDDTEAEDDHHKGR